MQAMPHQREPGVTFEMKRVRIGAEARFQIIKMGEMWEGGEAEDVCQKPPSNHSDKRFSSRALSIKKENIKQVSNKLKNLLSRVGNFFQVKTEKKSKHKEKIRLVHF